MLVIILARIFICIHCLHIGGSVDAYIPKKIFLHQIFMIFKNLKVFGKNFMIF